MPFDKIEELLEKLKKDPAKNKLTLKKIEEYEAKYLQLRETFLSFEDPVKLVEEVKALTKELIEKSYKDYTKSYLSTLETRIEIILKKKEQLATTKDSNIETAALEAIDQELDSLKIIVKKLDNDYIEGVKDAIDDQMDEAGKYDSKEYNDIQDAFSDAQKGYDAIKDIFKHLKLFTQVDKLKENTDLNYYIDKDKKEAYKDLSSFEKEMQALKDENSKKSDGVIEDLDESIRIDYKLNVAHYKGKLNFDEKDKILDEFASHQDIKHAIETFTDDPNDLKELDKELGKIKTPNNAAKIQELRTQLEEFLEKEAKKLVKKNLQPYLFKLPIFFKKVQSVSADESNPYAEGWVLDYKSTLAKNIKEAYAGNAALSVQGEVKEDDAPKFKKGIYTSSIQYTLKVTRGAFPRVKFDSKKFAGKALEISSGLSSLAGPIAWTEYAAKVVGAAVTNIKKVEENATTGDFRLLFKLKYDTTVTNSIPEIDITVTKNEFKALTWRKKHKFEPAEKEAGNKFKADINEQLK